MLCKKAGIYKIINLTNEKIYVGSSSDLTKRNRTHFLKLKNNKHENSILQNSYNKHGEENFKFEVIEYVEELGDMQEFKKILLEREQYWINKLKVSSRKYGYNICPTSGSNLGLKFSEDIRKRISEALKGRIPYNKGLKLSKEHINKILLSRRGYKHSEETRKNISKSNKGKKLTYETKLKIGIANRGKKRTEEQKRKLSEIFKGRIISDRCKEILRIRLIGNNYGVANLGKRRTKEQKENLSKIFKGRLSPMKDKKHSEESKIKMSIANKGKKRTPAQKAVMSKNASGRNNHFYGKPSPRRKKVINMDTYEIFNSILEASEFYSVSSGNIGRVCAGLREKAGKYRWCYYDL